MRVLAFLLAAICLIAIGCIVKIRVDFRYQRIQENDHIDINFRAFKGLWHANYKIPSIQLEWEKGPQMMFEQVAQGQAGARKTTTKAHMRYIRSNWLSELWLNIPTIIRRFKMMKREFYRGIHCTLIHWQAEIGYKDVCHTAIAAGFFWTMFGLALSHMNKHVTMEVKSPVLSVIPQYKKVGFSCDLKCTFHMRIGHVFWIGLKLLRICKGRIWSRRGS